MKTLAMQTWFCGAATAICAAGTAVSLAMRFTYWEPCFTLALIMVGIAGAFFFMAYKKLSAAKGIVETAVLRIHPVELCAQSDDEIKKWEKLQDEAEVYVSCFGILLGTTVVRFNQNGIKLKNIEIGTGYISFDYEIPTDEYGMEKEKQSIRLLYSRPDGAELDRIIETFSVHAGISPVITG